MTSAFTVFSCFFFITLCNHFMYICLENILYLQKCTVHCSELPLSLWQQSTCPVVMDASLSQMQISFREFGKQLCSASSAAMTQIRSFVYQDYMFGSCFYPNKKGQRVRGLSNYNLKTDLNHRKQF